MKDYINFDKSKDFKFIKKLGSGGTGQTILLLDETTNLEFAFKKFITEDIENEDDLYRRFVDEIKILFSIYHPNIVRIFNYYLYPDRKTGYIQMEYINGSTIEEYRKVDDSEIWNQIFIDLISAFTYLENNKILHRDIRPANILITSEGKPKIIDFGFGLAISPDKNSGTSILLNWPVTQWPDELVGSNPIYTFQSEIYFLGKLLKKLDLNKCSNFKYNNIISKMTNSDPVERYSTFSEVSSLIAKRDLQYIEFTTLEKDTYKKFADNLINITANHLESFNPVNDIEVVTERLSKLVQNSSLEEYAQDYRSIIRCFVDNEVSWFSRREFANSRIIDFYNMIIQMDSIRQQTIIDNIIIRLSKVKIEYESDIPF